MTDEEKRALRNLENLSEFGLSTSLNQADLDKMKIVLNLVEKQNKVIDKVLQNNLLNIPHHIEVCNNITANDCNNFRNNGGCNECIKQYFYRKVENENEI